AQDVGVAVAHEAVGGRAAGGVLDVGDAAGAGGRAGGRHEGRARGDLAADHAGGEGRVVDVQVGQAAQEGGLVAGGERHARRREGEAVGDRRQRPEVGAGGGVEQVDDDRAVDTGGGAG